MNDQTYWNNNGKHQAAYETLYAELVPMSGKCETIEGELIRAAGRIYYDAYNNGFINNTSGAVLFLKNHLPSQTDMVSDAIYRLYTVCNTGYYATINNHTEDDLEVVVNTVIEYVISKNGEYVQSDIDMFDYQEPDADWDDDDSCNDCGHVYCECEHEEYVD